MSRRAPGAGGRESGFSLVAAMSAIAVMMIMMGAAVPSWRYVMQNMREEELIFRGTQIAEAVERYQRKHGGAAPTSIEDLVKGKFLRKAWTDPMTREGKWRLLRAGEAGGMRFRQRDRNRRGLGGEMGAAAAADRFGAAGIGGFVGLATTFEGEAFRMFNGQTKYDEWFFVAGQPRIVGRPQTIGPGLKGLPGTRPGSDLPRGRGDRERPQAPDR